MDAVRQKVSVYPYAGACTGKPISGRRKGISGEGRGVRKAMSLLLIFRNEGRTVSFLRKKGGFSFPVKVTLHT